MRNLLLLIRSRFSSKQLFALVNRNERRDLNIKKIIFNVMFSIRYCS